MADAEQLKLAVQILAQVADRAMVDGPTGRQRDQAVQVLAKEHGLESVPPPSANPDRGEDNPPIEMPEIADN